MPDLEELLAEIGAPRERREDGSLTVRVPCEARGELPVGIVQGERTLTLTAFVVRGPDRAHEAVYARLLRRHLSSHVWRFAMDEAGDIFAVAVVPRAGLRPADLDEVLGALSVLIDAAYESIVRTGFDVPADVQVTGAPPD
jgi:hypothetical protein